MKNSIFICILLFLCLTMSVLVSSQGSASLDPDDILPTSSQISRQSLLSVDKFRYLDVPELDEIMVYDDFECTFRCLHHPLCVFVNLAAEGDLWCELLSSDKYSNPNEYKEKKSSHHYFFESACAKKPCKNNSTCLNGFTDKRDRCLCSAGFKGRTCDEDINECIEGTSDCSADAVCNNIKGSYNCTCKPGYSGDGRTCENIDECATGKQNCSADAVCNNTKGSYNCTCKEGYYGDGNICCSASTCKEIFDRNVSQRSQVYPLMFGSQTIPVFCHMGNFGCGDGGWTLAMKIDGKQRTFHYDSQLWSNRNAYNFAGGKTGFDSQETKLPTYWNTSFSKICLGMKINHQLKFIVINRHANSLFSLIADGKYRATSLDRNTWKSLVGPRASLQVNCSKEGFNAVGGNPRQSKARIGITADGNINCSSCDSRIGFGTGGRHDDFNTCGNEATYSPDNGNKHIKAMGYILIQ